MKLYEVTHIPNGWDIETAGYFTDKRKAYRFAHLLTLIQRRGHGLRNVSFITVYQPSMRASQKLRQVSHLVCEYENRNNTGAIVIQPMR
jgi:hypothetical protein